jgi:pimeloyl-ACP methyl ester carboxylesterase
MDSLLFCAVLWDSCCEREAKMHSKTIIAIHGAGMNGAVWDALELDIPLESLTLSGHGEDDAALLPSIAAMAQSVAERLDTLPLQSVILMGHSMGALAALGLAKHPSVAGLILLGAAAAMPVHADLLKLAAENPQGAADMVVKWSVYSAHTQKNEIAANVQTMMYSVPDAALLNDLNACNDYHDGAVAARAVRVPTIVISGQDDKMARAGEGQKLADLIAGAEFHAIPSCGHMMMAEHPREVSAIIHMFFKHHFNG